MKMKSLLWLLLGLTTTSITNAAEILAITPIAAASHWNVMSSVLEVLLNRGHKITVVSAFARPTPHENYTQIDISKHVKFAIASPWETVVGTYRSPTKCLYFLNEVQQATCRVAFVLPELRQTLLARHFDLVITELLASRCDAYVASYLGVPHVTIMSSQMLTWYQDSFDSPSNPSYMSTLHSPYHRPETFVQRLLGVIDYITINVYARYVDATATEMGRQRFGRHLPDAETLLRNVSMVFLNTHSEFDLHKPMATNFKEIGGIHLKPLKPLPMDIQKCIDNAEHGVIYFSLGSVVRMKELPTFIQEGIKEGFAELPQTILWKLESDHPMENKPKNVFTKKWFPQFDVIRHPNVKLFITHGGNSGTIEAVSAGIPVLGFPIFFDQERNLELFKHWGSGLYVDYNNFTKKDFVDKIKLILNDPRFKENAVALSNRFKDRPVSPQDTVAYWTEYVLRHNGAHHLKSQAVNTEWFKENAVALSNRFNDRPISPQNTVAYWTEYVLRHNGAHHLKSQAIKTEWYKYYSLDFLLLVFVVVVSLMYFWYSVLSILQK